MVTMTFTEINWKNFIKVMWFYYDRLTKSLQINLNLIGVSLWSFCPNLVIWALADFVAIALAEKELYCFVKIKWFYKDDI